MSSVLIVITIFIHHTVRYRSAILRISSVAWVENRNKRKKIKEWQKIGYSTIFAFCHYPQFLLCTFSTCIGRVRGS